MESDFSLNAEGNLRRFVDRINALSCIRFLIVSELVFKVFCGSLICFTLFVKRDEQCPVPLKAFLLGYVLLNTLKGVTFFLKNKSFFRIRRVTEFEENNGMTLVNNFLEALLLFWYILGFHWVQECTLCREENAVLYYLTISCIFTGFLTFVTPLIAILLLLLLVTYAKPKLKTVSYNGGDEIADNNRRCAICIDDYTKGSLIKFLPCKHHFHANCIDEWFTVRDSCPLCNRHVNMLYDLVDPSNTEV